MTALENRVIKSKLVDVLESMGFKVNATDTAYIAVFTDRPISSKSDLAFPGTIYPYLTSFGVKGAMKFIENNKKKYPTVLTGEL